MIIRATGNYGFWCREDYGMEVNATFLFRMTLGLQQSMVYEYHNFFVLSRVAATLLKIAILFHSASLLRALRWLALWLLTRADKLTEYLRSVVSRRRRRRSVGIRAQSRSKLLTCPADQPTASDLGDKNTPSACSPDHQHGGL